MTFITHKKSFFCDPVNNKGLFNQEIKTHLFKCILEKLNIRKPN